MRTFFDIEDFAQQFSAARPGLVCEFWLFLSTLAIWRAQAKQQIKISAAPPAALNADRVKKRPDLKR